ncbi:hypothetical protein FPZ52_06335 [Qingshengfaniella alkalisoli]|uniref:Uncharacterized protein n=1 Tax=Qingshengfaniella alkalisoli TaxID=2599296 RepID=A0A5B8IVW0_9RHOB|nr:hypothetical protein FPZ52_06335 [Qingshengfaniella alkalisoli]
MLAHERVLQALIAYMARTEPRFINHLNERFVEPMRMAKHEHDHRETDDYAEEFIRAVILLGEARVLHPEEPNVINKQSGSPKGQKRERPFMERPAKFDPVQVRERNGIWEVMAEGKVRSDYHQKEQALAAAALLRLSQR